MERTIAKLEIQNSGLEERLQAQITLNESQQAIIEEQENRISELQDQLETFQKEQSLRNDNLQSRLNEYTKFKTTLPSNNDSASSFFTINTTDEPDTVQVAVESIRDVVDEIQRWLFVEGGNLRDVESLLTEYCKFCRDRIGLPVDRLFIAGMMFPPTISAYVWKWEVGQKFEEHEVPHEAFVKPNYNPDEPFAVLLEGRAMEYRMKGDQNEEIPPGCAWFIENGYQDYFALPIYHRGEFKGAMAWCTKQATGFTQDHIDAFYSSLAALSTVLRLHTNEIVLKTLVEDFGKELKTQTENMQKTNAQLAQANQHILQQSRAQIQHFAMMSHEIRTPLNGIIGISNLLLSRFENDHGDYVYVDDSVRTVEPLDDTGKSTSEFLDDTSKTIESSVDANDDFRESVQMIVSSGDLLLAVVNDVLDYSKLVTGKVETTIEPTNLNRCFRPVLEAIKLKARSNGLNLRTSIDEETVPTHMDLDGRRLQQILYNLLGNAVKFGKQRQGYTNSVDDDHDNEDDDAHHHHHHLRKETIDNNQGYIDFTVTTFVTIKNENEDETKKKDVKDGNDEDHDHDDDDDHDDKEVDDGSSQKNDAVVPSGRSLRISVKDYGKGIAPSEQTKIFEPFQQATTNEATDGGTGLGLAITKLLTEVLGGNISVSSEYGKWSEFVVELPILNAKKEIGDGAANDEEREEEVKEGRPQRRLSCVSSGAATLPSFPPLTTIDDDNNKNNNNNNKNAKEKEEKRKPSSSSSSSSLSSSSLKILIAEDNLVNQKVLQRTLERLGIKSIDVVDNGQKAVDAAKQTFYDFIFMDWQMPIMNGLQATLLLKQELLEEQCPKIIFLTAHALKDYQEKATEVGGDGFISKPFKINHITDLLKRLRSELEF